MVGGIGVFFPANRRRHRREFGLSNSTIPRTRRRWKPSSWDSPPKEAAANSASSSANSATCRPSGFDFRSAHRSRRITLDVVGPGGTKAQLSRRLRQKNLGSAWPLAGGSVQVVRFRRRLFLPGQQAPSGYLVTRTMASASPPASPTNHREWIASDRRAPIRTPIHDHAMVSPSR